RISFHEALRVRLLRNYIPLFALLLVCWFLKLSSIVQNPEAGVASYLEAMQIGNLPGWFSLVFVAAIYAYLLGVIGIIRRPESTSDDLWPDARGRIADIDF